MKKLPKCRITGKTRYPNKKMAGYGLRYMWSHDPHADMLDLHIYECKPGCNGFHIGHKSYYEEVLKRQSESSVPQSEA